MATLIQKKVAQQIVETVKDVCGHDINFIDRNGSIFASTDPARVGNFHEVGKQVIERGETIEVTDDLGYFGTHKGVNIPFLHHGEVIAVIGITGNPGEVRKYAYLAQRITALIVREHELDSQRHSEEAERNYLIRSLITGEQVNHQFLTGWLSAAGLDIGIECRTAVIQLRHGFRASDHPNLEQEIRQLFQSTGSSLFTFHYPNEYVLILENRLWQGFTPSFQFFAREHQDCLRMGIGASSPLIHQQQSYESAQLALTSLTEHHSFACFDDLDLEILLGTLPDSPRRHYLAKTIDALSDRDCAILQAYFDNDTSLKKTCGQLYLHKNTLQYQLDRIGTLSGYNPRKFQDAVTLYLALKLKKRGETAAVPMGE